MFVDLGFLRDGEAKEEVCLFGDHYNFPATLIGASEMFLDRPAGISDPDQKCKIICASFIETFLMPRPAK